MSAHAYRASDQLAAALRQRREELSAWSAQVVAWDAEHPDTPMLWSRSAFGGDKRLCGFADKRPDQPPPAGLSRAQSRVELIPARGRKGDPWREVVATFDTSPSIDEVFRDHDVQPYLIVHEHGRCYTPGIWEDGDTWWITCTVPLFDGGEHPHLTPAPLSEYYAAKEAADARKDAEVAS